MNLVPRLRVIALVTLTSLSAVAAIGCDDGAGAKYASVKPDSMPEGEAWDGVYYHPVFGYLHLEQQGTNLVGRWKRTDQSQWGELSGTVTGNVAHYTWKEHKIGMLGASATSKGKGYFVYKVNNEKIGELVGEFGLNDSEVGSNWNNVKQLRMQPDLKSIGGDGDSLGSGF